MEEETATAKKNNEGANARHWREWRKMKQEVLAEMIGVSQATLSTYENSETLKPEVVEKLAKALDIPVEAITEMNNEKPINIFSGTWQDNAIGPNLQPTFNPLDKLVEIYDKKIALYERMLQTEREKVELLQEVLKDKK